jgi:hypothetical protein
MNLACLNVLLGIAILSRTYSSSPTVKFISVTRITDRIDKDFLIIRECFKPTHGAYTDGLF